MGGKGKGLRERKERDLLRSILEGLVENGKLKVRHEVHLMGGHTGAITSLAVTPDGKRLVTGSLDKTARLWDLETGTLIQVFKGHTGCVNAVAITSDGRWLVTGSGCFGADNTARLWDLATGKCTKVFAEHTGPVLAVTVTLDG